MAFQLCRPNHCLKFYSLILLHWKSLSPRWSLWPKYLLHNTQRRSRQRVIDFFDRWNGTNSLFYFNAPPPLPRTYLVVLILFRWKHPFYGQGWFHVLAPEHSVCVTSPSQSCCCNNCGHILDRVSTNWCSAPVWPEGPQSFSRATPQARPTIRFFSVQVQRASMAPDQSDPVICDCRRFGDNTVVELFEGHWACHIAKQQFRSICGLFFIPPKIFWSTQNVQWCPAQ